MSKLTIGSVQHDFKVWRASRPTKGKIPEHLWDKVFKLLESYPVGQVVQALRLSGTQVVARRNQREQRETNSTVLPMTCPINFVELGMPPSIPCDVSVTNPNSCSRLEIRRSDGAVLVIERLAEQTMLQIFSQFTRGAQ